MKKRVACLSLIFIFMLASLILSGCDLKVTPCIKVVGLKSEFNIGESLNIASGMIHYYEDVDSDTYTEIALKSTMVSGFSTANAGTFTMTVTYKDLISMIEYKVIDPNDEFAGAQDITTEKAKTLYANAIAAIATKEQLKITNNMGFMGKSVSIYNGDSAYVKSTFIAENESWIVKENTTNYQYTKAADLFGAENSFTYTKSVVEEDSDFSDEIEEDFIVSSDAEIISAKRKNDVLKIVYNVNEDGVTLIEYTIDSGLITKIDYLDDENFVLARVSFEYSDVVIPPLPTKDGEGNTIIWELE